MTVDYKAYMTEKKAFLSKHHNDWTVDTSSMDSYGCYYKRYICADGAIWYECMSPEWVSEYVDMEIKMCKVAKLVEVKMLRTEFYSSDNAQSKFYYEVF